MKKILFIATLFILCIGLCCLNCYPDNDLWARLIAGAHIVEKLSVLKYDFLSYTKTHPWYDHEWGASVFFYLALKYFGHSGLIILKGLLAGITLFFCYKTVEIRKPQSTIPYNIAYFAIMFLVAYKNLGPTTRCLLFTCVFFSIFLYILELSRTGKKKQLFLLPFLMIIWSNIHGGCMSGIGLIGLYIVGEFLNKKSFKEYIYTLLGCLGALFINPYGFEYVKFLFFATTMKREMITEWRSSFIAKNMGLFIRYKLYLISMIFIQVAYLIKNKINYEKLDKTKLLIILAMTYLSVTHIRHHTFFIFAVGTLLYDEFYSLFNSLIAKIQDKFNIKNEDNIKTFILAKEVIIYFILLIISIPPILEKDKLIEITSTKYPRYAVEFVKINELKGNLLTSFNWGSYIAYKLYPHNLISMDGRYEEVYDPSLLVDINNFNMIKNNWDKILKEYKTDIMIIDAEYPIFDKLLNSKDWTLVFENNIAGVFVPTEKVKDKYIYPRTDDEYYNITLFNTDIKF
ncbi:MAG: hypothetical protein IJY61_07295 [Candidatus Gastranaerophilales bacterium]|nr:hypothetical protein [Candidatus Gastranaerophilales bacterium]